jgi:two-component SAPR family response regulator
VLDQLRVGAAARYTLRTAVNYAVNYKESPTIHLQMADHGNELNGVRLLVVEDNYLVATDLCSALLRRGAIILGPAGSLPRTRELLRRQTADCALLDLNLNGVLAFELAEDFQRAGVPTIFTTGYDPAFVPEGLRDVPCLQKPVNFNALVRLIRRNACSAQSGPP